MFLATSILQNWGFWVGVVAVVAIIAIIVTNIIIDSKIKQIEKKDIAEKEKKLHEKLYPSEKVEDGEEQSDTTEQTSEEQKQEAPAEEEKTEEAKPVEEDKTKEAPAEEEKAEEAKPVEEDKTKEAPAEEEKAEEAKLVEEDKTIEAPAEEEKTEEAKPIEEEKVEKAPAEEEKTEEKKPVKATAKKAPVKEAKKEPVEEKKDEKSDKEAEKEAEDLLKDIPDSNEIEKELEEKQAQEEAVKEEEMKKEEQEVKPTPKTSNAKDANNKPKQSNGKWLLIPESDGYFFGKLFANNGEMLLQTERYKGVSGLKSGIETIKKNIAKDNFEITVDKNKTYNFKLFASNQGLLCIGEGYTSRENALSAIQSVKNFSNSLTFVSDETEQIEEKVFSIKEDEKNPNGKWVIYEGTDGYDYAELKANNGQVLFVTEQYKGINSLRTGLDSVRKSISKGNFAMRKDKNDNYNFKLFSENKRLLGIGAGYTSATNCESAILSVMKFCDSVIVFNNAEEVEE